MPETCVGASSSGRPSHVPVTPRASAPCEGLLELWVVRIARAAGHAQIVPLGLSADEEARANRYARADLRLRFRLARAVARSIVGRKCRLNPKDVRFATGAHGKPSLADFPELAFNASHSQDRILLGLLATGRGAEGDAGLGVDIEAVRDLPGCLDIAHRVFDPARAAALARLEGKARESHFFRDWVEWEAGLKAHGLGIAAAERAGLLRATDPTLMRGRIDAGAGYEAAWASRAPVAALVVRSCVAALGEGGRTLAFSEGAAQHRPIAAADWRLQ